jgi:hypothetical protein
MRLASVSTCSPRCIFDWDAHPDQSLRSGLRHGSLDNGFMAFFEPDNKEAAAAVLTGRARSEEYKTIRLCLARWQVVRADVESNLEEFSTTYTPFQKGLNRLRAYMEPSSWKDLSMAHRALARERLGIDGFVDSVRAALGAFEEGIGRASKNEISIEDLKMLHGAMVDAYRWF